MAARGRNDDKVWKAWGITLSVREQEKKQRARDAEKYMMGRAMIRQPKGQDFKGSFVKKK